MRRAARVDANHAACVRAFRNLGCSVVSLAAVGGGVPDLLVGIRGHNVLVEVKDGDKAPSRRALTAMQVEFRKTWYGTLWRVENIDDVNRIVHRYATA